MLEYVLSVVNDMNEEVFTSNVKNRYVFKHDGHAFAMIMNCRKHLRMQIRSKLLENQSVEYTRINYMFDAVIKFTENTSENRELIKKLLVASRDYQLNKKSNSKKEEK